MIKNKNVNLESKEDGSDVESGNNKDTKKPKKKLKKNNVLVIKGDEYSLSEDEFKKSSIEDDEENQEDSLNISSTKKNPELDERLLKRQIRQHRKSKVQNYFSGSSYGFPACYIIYQIAKQLNLESNEFLWQYIVSSTDHFLHDHLTSDQYEKLFNECRVEVSRLNQGKSKNPILSYYNNIKKKNVSDSSNSNQNSNLLNNSKIESEVNLQIDEKEIELKSNNREAKSILVEPDYRLFLYRHWNLFDSLVYSNYTVSSLNSWKEPGRKEIQKLLAFIGIPLEESKQKFLFMKNEFKQLFKEKIMEVCKKFEMKDLIYQSFVYQFDQKSQFSASDYVYCLSALLEYPFNIHALEENFINEVDDSSEVNKAEEEKNDLYIEQTSLNKDLKYDNYWVCYEFLALKNPKLLKISIEQAIKFQIALVNNGTSLIDKKSIIPSRNFRYSVIRSDISDEIKYFQHPLSLVKLALFIMDTYHTSKSLKNSKIKPFILAIANTLADMFMVVGVLGSSRSFEEKNQFSIRFRCAGEKVGAKLIMNNFDDSIVEIPKGEFDSFLEELCAEDI